MLGREGRRLTDWLVGGGLVGWQRRCAAEMVVGHMLVTEGKGT